MRDKVIFKTKQRLADVDSNMSNVTYKKEKQKSQIFKK